MGLPKGSAVLAAGAVALAIGLGATPAQAQEAGRRFGDRDEFIVSVERIFGFSHIESGDDGDSGLDSTGLHPVYWAGLGLFSVSSSGLNFGALLGFTRLSLEDDDGDDLSFTIAQLRPRIGYAGSVQDGKFGFWIRGGPTGVFAHSEDNDSYTLGVGGEAYAVILPAPHVGILAGPHADFHIAGGGDGDPEYRGYGLTFGVMGEFY